MPDTFRDLQSFYRTTLSQSAGAGDTTIIVAVAPAVNSCYLVIEPNTNNEEIVLMTSKSGTTLTVTRGLAISGSSEASGSGKAHPAGAAVIIADAHYYIKKIQINKAFEFRGSYASLAAIQAIATPALGDMAIDTSTGYVYWYNGSAWAAIGGGSAPADASTTVKGVSKLSVAPASATNPIAVGDNDPRVPTQGEKDALAGTAGTPGSTNKYVTNNDTGETGAGKAARVKATGKLDDTIIPDLALFKKTFIAGEAIDASVTPQVVYVKASDGKVYKAQANADTEVVYGYVGFVGGGQNVALGASVTVTLRGVVSGFSGLTIGAIYYISGATVGAITATIPSDRALQIGIAASATELLIFDGDLKFKQGSLTNISRSDSGAAGNEDVAVTLGFRPRLLILYVEGVASGGTSRSDGKGFLTAGLINPLSGFGFSGVAQGGNLTASNLNPLSSIASSVDTFITGTLSILSIGNTGFTVRVAWSGSFGGGGSRIVTFQGLNYIVIG